jgi:hypothetical protein
MKKLLLIAFAICLMVPSVYAKVESFSWEDGVSTILGSYGSLVEDTNVSGAQGGQEYIPDSSFTCPGAYDGTYYLHVAEDPHSGTPQAYLACITGLEEGDTVHVTFYGYDETPGVSPSWRLWGGYHDAGTCADCPGAYVGSAGSGYENSGYSPGDGWDEMNASWEYSPSAGATSLVIQGRLYSWPSTADPGHTDFFGDLIIVEVPDYATVTFPDFGPSATESGTWGGIKALYR